MNKQMGQSPTTTILIAGATGMLGMKIAQALQAKDKVRVRLLVRDPQKAVQKLSALIARGAEMVQGDLGVAESLTRVCDGVDVVISAAQGDRDVIVTGQYNLLQVAERAGVQRFMPSDYSFDYFRLDEGDNYNADLRRTFAALLKASSVPYTFFLNGAFTEIELTPWGTLFDEPKTTFSYWGDGETHFDITTTDDTARFVAEVVLDPAYKNKEFQIAGDTLTAKHCFHTYQEITGKRLKEQSMGSVQELKALIEQKKQA